MTNFFAGISSQEEYVKKIESSKLRKTSNGLGFYVLIYYLTLQFSILALMVICELTNLSLSDSRNISLLFYVEIFGSVFSAVIPGLFYLLITNKRLSEIIPFRHIKVKNMIPLIMMGMGIAMLANAASELLSDNLSLFGLKKFSGSETTVVNFTDALLYILSTAIVPAFAEEFAFRGIVMGSLRKYGDAIAIMGSAILFGAMHCNASQTPFAFILGLTFAYIDCKTNSLLPSIIIHFVNNFYAVVVDLLQNSVNLPDSTVYTIYFTFISAFLVLAVLSFIYIIKTDRNFLKFSDRELNKSSNLLDFKEKTKLFMLNPGVIISMSIFSLLIIYFLVF